MEYETETYEQREGPEEPEDTIRFRDIFTNTTRRGALYAVQTQTS